MTSYAVRATITSKRTWLVEATASGLAHDENVLPPYPEKSTRVTGTRRAGRPGPISVLKVHSTPRLPKPALRTLSPNGTPDPGSTPLRVCHAAPGKDGDSWSGPRSGNASAAIWRPPT